MAVQSFPHIAEFIFVTTTFYSYGRHSPGLIQSSTTLKAQYLPYLTFRHWSGVTPYTSSYEFAGSCVFDKQSAKQHSLRPLSRSRDGRAYSEVTPAFLPSSLGSNHHFTLVFSTRPPVSVLGYGSTRINLRRFSWKRAPLCLCRQNDTSRLRSELRARIFLKRLPHGSEANPITLKEYNSPSLRRIHVKSWNINHVSIESGFRHSLRPD